MCCSLRRFIYFRLNKLTTMLRYVLLISLVNYHGYGLGNPLPTTEDVGAKFVQALINLANTCSNNFLSVQIQSKIEECSKVASLYDNNAIKCMLFYDINKRLCSDVRIQSMSLDSDNISEERVNVVDICENAMTWNFTALPEFENYKNYSSLFKNSSSCSDICVISKYITSNDSSYFCKYYYWGSKIISRINMKQKSEDSGLNAPNTAESEKKVPAFGSDEAKTKSSTVVASKVIEQENLTVAQAPQPSVIAENSIINETVKNNKSVVIVPPESPQNKNEDVIPETVPENPTGQKIQLSVEKISDAKVETPMEEQKTINIPDKEKIKEIAFKIPKPNDTYDDPDSDGEIGGEDTQVQDEDDSVNVDLDEQLNKPNKSKVVNIIEPPILENKQRDMFPDAIQEGFPEEDEDHFFTFFLSAVVLIIVLYVLYHNKSKVSKVVLGLIVEGRQSGRRRNSRGHSYRRLDTLEQAISTNPTAAPTKIIY